MNEPQLPGLTPAGLGVEDWKRSIADKLYYTLARFPAVATANDRYLAVALAVRDRLLERWLATAATYAREGSRTVCYLSAEFLLGPHLGNNLLNLGVERAGAPGARRDWARPRRAARAGGGAGARQRRPRAARRLLPRLAGDARDPGDRLRHPLRVRHLRPGDPRRLAGRDDRQVAAPRQPVGDPAARDRVPRAASAAAPRRVRDARRPAARALDARARWCGASPTTRRSSATASTP